MGFVEAIQSGFQNYVNFSGRAMRSEFWYWTLFTVLLGLVAGIVDGIVGTGMMIGNLASLVVLLPGIAVAIRRLHDIGKSAWWLLLILIPVLGWIYLIYLYVQPTQSSANTYGPVPAGAAAA